jgi:hypothetical protein
MASEFATFWRLGVGHIADLRGYDHILFIVALTAGYRMRDWRQLVWLVTAFTLGHSLTLALATLNVIRVRAGIIEVLIAVTIVVSAVYALIGLRQPDNAPRSLRAPYAMAGGFGLIHGLGFSTFLRSALGMEESIALPLFAFNVGLEVGQILIVVSVLLAATIVVDVLGLARRWWVGVLSLVIAMAGVVMIVDRVPRA